MLTKHDVSTITRIAYAYGGMRYDSDSFVSDIYKTSDFLEVIKLIDLKLNSFKREYHIADFLLDEYIKIKIHR